MATCRMSWGSSTSWFHWMYLTISYLELFLEFKGMLSLLDVNFSNNQLNGPVPIFTPFQKSPPSSFLRNKGLFGDPLSTNCTSISDTAHENNHHKYSYKMVLAVIGSGLAVFFSVSVVVILFTISERKEMKANQVIGAEEIPVASSLVIIGNVFVDSLKQAVDFESVAKATMKDTNKLSNGTFSTAYKANMPSGLVLSVKKLKFVDRTVVHHQNKMIRELERFGNLIHPNLMRPIGYVVYQDVALLLHPHIVNGTLAQLLHESPKDEYEPDWPRRLSIAISLAEGLAFLHHVHLDISSCKTHFIRLCSGRLRFQSFWTHWKELQVLVQWLALLGISLQNMLIQSKLQLQEMSTTLASFFSKS